MSATAMEADGESDADSDPSMESDGESVANGDPFSDLYAYGLDWLQIKSCELNSVGTGAADTPGTYSLSSSPDMDMDTCEFGGERSLRESNVGMQAAVAAASKAVLATAPQITPTISSGQKKKLHARASSAAPPPWLATFRRSPELPRPPPRASAALLGWSPERLGNSHAAYSASVALRDAQVSCVFMVYGSPQPPLEATSVWPPYPFRARDLEQYNLGHHSVCRHCKHNHLDVCLCLAGLSLYGGKFHVTENERDVAFAGEGDNFEGKSTYRPITPPFSRTHTRAHALLTRAWSQPVRCSLYINTHVAQHTALRIAGFMRRRNSCLLPPSEGEGDTRPLWGQLLYDKLLTELAPSDASPDEKQHWKTLPKATRILLSFDSKLFGFSAKNTAARFGRGNWNQAQRAVSAWVRACSGTQKIAHLIHRLEHGVSISTGGRDIKDEEDKSRYRLVLIFLLRAAGAVDFAPDGDNFQL